MTKPTWRDTLRGLLLDNLGLKLISLFCALGLFVFIHSGSEGSRTFNVSVVAIMPPETENRQLMIQPPTEVAVTLRGTRATLDDLRAGDLGSLELDLRRGRANRIELSPEMFDVPTGLKVERIYPPTIDLKWDDVVTRQLPVQVPRAGEPDKGYTVRATAAQPSNITVRGPKSLVDSMQSARTEPFDVTGLSEGLHKKELPLDRPFKGSSYNVDTVTATVEIGREEVSKRFEKVPVQVIGLPRATVTPQSVTVLVTGTEEEIAALSPDAVIARVEPKLDPEQVKAGGSAFLDVLVDLPRLKIAVTPPKVVVKW